jgi:hypothetical protein
MSDESEHDERLGREVDHGFDADGRQWKEKVFGIAACPVCGEDVELVAETEVWVQGDDGRWVHSGYGPAQGVCCDRLVVDSWDGCSVYDLSGVPAAGDPDDEDGDDPWEPDLGGEA